ncbi:hypothetical protein GCM10010912_50600 [Paenibacillus albidus]|uniref:Uncharacterized protein n=1 Tax=Paenibacillus albidus TaxID=2041023 RepID=A0A917FQG4_9BACL|nr:hypothetical protein [Paenibacillus albidus]GGF99677.1 hypothetical protein GCM10010912_50600 [Paenibacillus albidus]
MMELVRGVVTGESLLGFDLLIGTGDGELEKLETVSRLLCGRRADGATVLSTGKEDLEPSELSPFSYLSTVV